MRKLSMKKMFRKCLEQVEGHWLSHGEAENRVTERYKSVKAACDTIFSERGDCDIKGVRDQLIQRDVSIAITQRKPTETNKHFLQVTSVTWFSNLERIVVCKIFDLKAWKL